MPRGDMVGSATFLDRKNSLQGEVIFGKVSGKDEDPLLQRTDSLRAAVYEVDATELSRPPSPDESAANGHSVRSQCF